VRGIPGDCHMPDIHDENFNRFHSDNEPVYPLPGILVGPEMALEGKMRCIFSANLFNGQCNLTGGLSQPSTKCDGLTDKKSCPFWQCKQPILKQSPQEEK
jgi:hypothetical protein